MQTSAFATRSSAYFIKLILYFTYYILSFSLISLEEEVIDDSSDQFLYDEVPVDEDFVTGGKAVFIILIVYYNKINVLL